MTSFNWKSEINVNICMLKIVGLWPNDDDGYQRSLYTIYAIIAISVFAIGHNVFQTINVYFVYTNIEALSGIIFVTITDLLALIKVYYFIKNITLVKDLLNTLNSSILQPKNTKQENLVRKSLGIWKVIYITFWIPVGATLCLWAVFPILDGSFQTSRLPFSAWYPFDIKKSPVYEFIYIYQVTSIWFLATANLNMDMMITALLMYIGAQCDILCSNACSINTLKSSNYQLEISTLINQHHVILRF